MMIKLKEFIDDYIGTHQIGNADYLISDFIKNFKLDHSSYDDIKLEVEKILLERSDIIFSKTTGKYTLLDSAFKNPVTPKLQPYGSLLSGRLLGKKIDNINEFINNADIEEIFKDFSLENLGIYKTVIHLNYIHEEVSVTITISANSFQIRTFFSNDLNKAYPFLEFLEGKNDYILNKKGYLPLDSILYLSFKKIRNLLTSKYKDLDLKIDTYEHIQ